MGLLEHETEKLEVLKEIRDSLRILVEEKGTPPKKFFTKAEVCKRLGVSPNTVDRLVQSGEWKAYFITDETPRFNIDEFEGRLRTSRRAPRINRRAGGLRRTREIEGFVNGQKKRVLPGT